MFSFAGQSALAQDGDSDPIIEAEKQQSSLNGWRIDVTPYAYLASMNLDATTGGATAELDLDFKDIWDNFDVYAFSVHVEAWHEENNIGLIFDGSYLQLDGEFDLDTPGPFPPSIDVDVNVKMAQLMFGVGTTIFEKNLSETNPDWKLILQVMGGVRYNYLEEKIKGSVGMGSLTLGGDEEWFEPWFGGRIVMPLNEKWALSLYGDVGGFGIGDAAQLTYNVIGFVSYKLKENTRLRVGYRVFGMDYDSGGGASRIGVDGILHGPMIGMDFTFK